MSMWYKVIAVLITLSLFGVAVAQTDLENATFEEPVLITPMERAVPEQIISVKVMDVNTLTIDLEGPAPQRIPTVLKAMNPDTSSPYIITYDQATSSFSVSVQGVAFTTGSQRIPVPVKIETSDGTTYILRSS